LQENRDAHLALKGIENASFYLRAHIFDPGKNPNARSLKAKEFTIATTNDQHDLTER
jgi:hypothetical protein